MSLATELESTATTSATATATATVKHELLTQPADSGISTAAISKKLPLKITQDDNRLIINLVPTPALQQRANRSKSDQNHKTISSATPSNTPSDTVAATADAPAAATAIAPATTTTTSTALQLKRQSSSTTTHNRRSNRSRDRSQNENLIRIIKENIEPLNQLQPCDLFV